MEKPSVVIVGSGIFGTVAALDLAKRGYKVDVFDRGNSLHPEAASTDISKLVRPDYGSDELYAAMTAVSVERWLEWNKKWGVDLFHHTGVLILSAKELEEAPESFESQSFRTLRKMGIPVKHLGPEGIKKDFPLWNPEIYKDGYVSLLAGWVESGRVVGMLQEEAEEVWGVTFHTVGVKKLMLRPDGKKVYGVLLDDGQPVLGDAVMVATGSWVQDLVPGMEDLCHSSAQWIHLYGSTSSSSSSSSSSVTSSLVPPSFLPYAADIGHTGFYGFPLHPTEGVLKIGKHATGVVLKSTSDSPVSGSARDWAPPIAVTRNVTDFIETSWPGLAHDLTLNATRCCYYCDTRDGHFLLDWHPSIEQLFVAVGGSGHAFKMAPVLGEIIGCRFAKEYHRWSDRFKWRKMQEDYEAARVRPRTVQSAL